MNSTEVTGVYELLSELYPTFDESDDEWMTSGLSETPFKSLVSVALSTMTTSPRTIKGAKALYAKATTFQELADLDDEELRAAIHPVAHYNRKTTNLKKMARQILDRHQGQVPTTRDELMALSGIGRKCTDIIMNTLNDDTSIAVDTHVHRLVNRLGMVDTDTAEDTADQLERVTPTRYRKHAHEWLIQHGMKVCTARSPRCADCPLKRLCASAPKAAV